MKIRSKSISLLTAGALTLNILYSNCSEFSPGLQPSLSSPSTEQNPPQNSSDCTSGQLADLEASIKTTLATVATDTDFSIAIRTEDGRSLEFDRGSVTQLTRFESASTSKWVAASTILLFMESPENQSSSKPLTLNSLISDFLSSSEWPISSTDPLSKITMRHLLSFTSGLKEESLCFNRPGFDFAECVKEIAINNDGNGLVPGQTFWYSGSHLQTAAMVAIKARNIAFGVSNSTWQNLFTDFRSKTGLFPTSKFDLPSESNPRIASGMHWIGVEYLDFVRSNYNRQILSDQPMPGESKTYLDQQFSDQTAGASIGSSPAIRIGEDWHYGFGTWFECRSASFNCGSTPDANSSPGAYGAYPFLNRKYKYYGMLARQGDTSSFSDGYDVFKSISKDLNTWASKSCSP